MAMCTSGLCASWTSATGTAFHISVSLALALPAIMDSSRLRKMKSHGRATSDPSAFNLRRSPNNFQWRVSKWSPTASNTPSTPLAVHGRSGGRIRPMAPLSGVAPSAASTRAYARKNSRTAAWDSSNLRFPRSLGTTHRRTKYKRRILAKSWRCSSEARRGAILNDVDSAGAGSNARRIVCSVTLLRTFPTQLAVYFRSSQISTSR